MQGRRAAEGSWRSQSAIYNLGELGHSRWEGISGVEGPWGKSGSRPGAHRWLLQGSSIWRKRKLKGEIQAFLPKALKPSPGKRKPAGIQWRYSDYSAIKKNEILPFAATWVSLEMITLSEVSQTKTNIMISLICGI